MDCCTQGAELVGWGVEVVTGWGGVASGPDRVVLATLVRLAALITGSPGADGLMEAVAETARELLGADSVSVSRLEEDRSTLRTLINVGSLGPGEQRWPVQETYQVADFPDSLAFLTSRPARRVATTVDDPEAEPAEVALLRSLGKSSSLKTPIILDGKMWGELWASRGPKASPFTDYDADLAQVIVGLVAAGLAQAAAWQAMQQLAATDPLTGLANRRLLDEHLRLHLARTQALGLPLTAVVGDINGLKAVNDTAGHAAGDDVILRVAAAAQGVVAATPNALAARLGGDEFALVLPVITSAQAYDVATRWCQATADPTSHVSLACGLATTTPGHPTNPRDLLNAADAAQNHAKRTSSTTPVIA